METRSKVKKTKSPFEVSHVEVKVNLPMWKIIKFVKCDTEKLAKLSIAEYTPENGDASLTLDMHLKVLALCQYIDKMSFSDFDTMFQMVNTDYFDNFVTDKYFFLKLYVRGLFVSIAERMLS